MTDFAPPRPPEPEDELLTRLDAEFAAALANPAPPDTWTDDADPWPEPSHSPAPDPRPNGRPSGPGPRGNDARRSGLDDDRLPWFGDAAAEAPAAERPLWSGSPAPQPGTSVAAFVGVIAPEAGLATAAGGIAAGLRSRTKARTVVVASFVALGVSGPPLPKAAALAKRLRAAGFDATAAASLCHVVLAGPGDCARLEGAVGVAPLVLAVGARDDEVDALLATADHLSLALPQRSTTGLAPLARESLEQVGPPVDLRRLPGDPLGRRTAALGMRPLASVEDDR